MHILDNVIFWMFMSFVIGLATVPMVRRTALGQMLQTSYLFRDTKTYESVGVLWFKNLLLYSLFQSFNTDIHFTKQRDLETLRKIRGHMLTAEIAHWSGFVVMMILTIVAWISRGTLVGAGFLIANVFGNLYPCLLQQYNKRRLNRLIQLAENRERG